MKRSIIFLLSFAVLTIAMSSLKVGKQEEGKDRVEFLKIASFDVSTDLHQEVVVAPDFAMCDLIAEAAGKHPGINESLSEGLKMSLFRQTDLPEIQQVTQITNYVARCPRDGLTPKPGGYSNKAWLV